MTTSTTGINLTLTLHLTSTNLVQINTRNTPAAQFPSLISSVSLNLKHSLIHLNIQSLLSRLDSTYASVLHLVQSLQQAAAVGLYS